jgi:hypothetical protein
MSIEDRGLNINERDPYLYFEIFPSVTIGLFVFHTWRRVGWCMRVETELSLGEGEVGTACLPLCTAFVGQESILGVADEGEGVPQAMGEWLHPEPCMSLWGVCS